MTRLPFVISSEFKPAVLKKLQASLAALPPRDRLALRILVLFLAVLASYFLAWKPSHEYRSGAANRYERSSALRTWMLANAAEVRQVDASDPARESSSSLLAVIDASAKAQDLRFQRYEPNAGNGVRVWFEDVAFNSVIVWLDQLSGAGIRTSQISVERQNAPGLVDISIELEQ